MPVDVVGLCHDEECCTGRALKYLEGRLDDSKKFQVYLEMDSALQGDLDRLLASQGTEQDVREFVRQADRKGIGYTRGRMCNVYLTTRLAGSGLDVRAVDGGSVESAKFHAMACYGPRERLYENVLDAARQDLRREKRMAGRLSWGGDGVLFVGYLHTAGGSFFNELPGVRVEKLCSKGDYPDYFGRYCKAKRELKNHRAGTRKVYSVVRDF